MKKIGGKKKKENDILKQLKNLKSDLGQLKKQVRSSENVNVGQRRDSMNSGLKEMFKQMKRT